MLKNKFLNDGFWTVLGAGFNAVQALVVNIILANILGKYIFGQYSFILSSLTTISIFLILGANVSLIIFVAKNKNKQEREKVLVTVFKLSLFLWLFLSAIALYFRNNFFINFSCFEFLTLIFLCFSLMSKFIFESVIQGEEKFVDYAKINIFIVFFNLTILYYFTITWGVVGAFLSMLISNIIKICLILRCVETNLNFNLKVFDKKFIVFGMPLAIQEYLYYLSSWLLLYLIVKYGGYSQVSSYNISLQLVMVVAFIPSVLKNIILSRFSSGVENNKAFLKKALVFNFLMTFSFSIILYLFLPLILRIYGGEYSDIYDYIPYFLLMVIVSSVANVYFQFCLTVGKSSRILLFRVIRDLGVFVIFYILFLLGFNVVISVAISLFVINIVFLLLIRSYTNQIIIGK